MGNVEAVGRDGPISLGVRKQRALLCALALHRGHLVSADALIDLLWGDDAPDRAQHTLQTYLSGLRKALEPVRGRGATPTVIRTVGGGYLLDVPPEALDSARFQESVRRAQARLGPGAAAAIPQVDPQAARDAAGLLDDALALWRGEPYLELADAAAPERARLQELALAARELQAVARIALGDAQRVAADLEVDAAANPYRERLRVLQALALVRSGRQAEALEVLRAVRELLADELGIDAAPELAQLETAILRQDPRLAPPAPPASASTPTSASATRDALGPAPSLPRRLTQLLGRDGAVDELAGLVRGGSTPLLTLVGPGGAGKTRLALALGAAAGDAFPDGVWWVDLSAVVDPLLVLPTVARALGLAPEEGGAVPALLVEHLRTARALLLLDNLEQVVSCGNSIVELLTACPSVAVVATSRVPLRVQGEQRWPVPPLELPEGDDVLSGDRAPSAELLLQRTRAVDPAYVIDDPVSFAALCRRLGGSPLSLELAAPWLAVLAPGDLLAQLESSLEVLVDGPADLPERQRTLRATVAWSVGLLPPAARDALAALGVLRGGGDLTAATAVLGRPALATVSTLVDHSLLRLQRDGRTTRITFDESVREYALELLAGSGEEEPVRQRHAEHYAKVVTDASKGLLGTEQAAWLRRLEEETANIDAALEHLRSSGSAMRALELALGMVGYWWRRGYLRQGRRMILETLASADAAGNHPDRRSWAVAQGRARQGSGLLAMAIGDRLSARDDLERAVHLFRSLGEDDADGLAGLARALPHLARVVRESEDDTAAAEQLLDEAERICRRLDAWLDLAWVLRYRAHYLALAGGDLEGAESLHTEALHLAQQREDTWAVAIAWLDLGEVARARGDVGVATRRTREALRLFSALDDRWYVTGCLHNLGQLALAQGEAEQAWALFEEAGTACSRLGNGRGVAECLAGSAATALALGRSDEARRLLAQADDRLLALGTHLDRTDQVVRDRTARRLAELEASG
nr:BTAD domain-containing putative transcriptional regulator [Motilibacter aurantiacus]